ncbi:hypothetical protein [uncultured Roseobacter sp.]|uniref:hypothetical protein n=1 Tax=uncultured Roseobacter sp. TaxID=114847 RepID=UPI002623C0D4|nr:hypothetical protein [uncultured Roseobacter sp.]
MRLWSLLMAPFRRKARQPLSHRQPEGRAASRTVPLGMEATDLDLIQSVNRRNAGLERVSTFFRPFSGQRYALEDAETQTRAFADDETYAARYHRAFNQKKAQTDE